MKRKLTDHTRKINKKKCRSFNYYQFLGLDALIEVLLPLINGVATDNLSFFSHFFSLSRKPKFLNSVVKPMCSDGL